MLNEPQRNEDSRDTFVRYRGMNPEFYEAAMARKKAEAEERHRREEEARLEAARLAAEDLHRKRREFWAKAVMENEAEKLRYMEETRAQRVAEVAKEAAKLFPMPVKMIVSRVAIEHGLTYADLIGYSKIHHIAAARHRAIRAVADERPDMAVLAIARAVKRDNSTVRHSLAKTRYPGASR